MSEDASSYKILEPHKMIFIIIEKIKINIQKKGRGRVARQRVMMRIGMEKDKVTRESGTQLMDTWQQAVYMWEDAWCVFAYIDPFFPLTRSAQPPHNFTLINK